MADNELGPCAVFAQCLALLLSAAVLLPRLALDTFGPFCTLALGHILIAALAVHSFAKAYLRRRRVVRVVAVAAVEDAVEVEKIPALGKRSEDAARPSRALSWGGGPAAWLQTAARTLSAVGQLTIAPLAYLQLGHSPVVATTVLVSFVMNFAVWAALPPRVARVIAYAGSAAVGLGALTLLAVAPREAALTELAESSGGALPVYAALAVLAASLHGWGRLRAVSEALAPPYQPYAPLLVAAAQSGALVLGTALGCAYQHVRGGLLGALLAPLAAVRREDGLSAAAQVLFLVGTQAAALPSVLSRHEPAPGRAPATLYHGYTIALCATVLAIAAHGAVVPALFIVVGGALLPVAAAEALARHATRAAGLRRSYSWLLWLPCAVVLGLLAGISIRPTLSAAVPLHPLPIPPGTSLAPPPVADLPVLPWQAPSVPAHLQQSAVPEHTAKLPRQRRAQLITDEIRDLIMNDIDALDAAYSRAHKGAPRAVSSAIRTVLWRLQAQNTTPPKEAIAIRRLFADLGKRRPYRRTGRELADEVMPSSQATLSCAEMVVNEMGKMASPVLVPISDFVAALKAIYRVTIG